MTTLRFKAYVTSFRLLFFRVANLTKMAFTASTAYVTEIRLAGLVVLRDVIEVCLPFIFFVAFI
jgi:HEAT repeat-containing protein 5